MFLFIGEVLPSQENIHEGMLIFFGNNIKDVNQYKCRDFFQNAKYY